MFFRVQSKNALPKNQLFALSIQKAKAQIVMFPIGAEEVLFDDYLKKHYKTGLKQTCFNLLNKLKAEQVSETEILFIFIDDEADKLASFITYGDGFRQGSEILVNALTRKVRGI
jgi:hypothetical protein